ncbi:hypothetical protein M3A96_10695 [Helcobacillus massiliensis]|uniref:hypothetical protein n=1 Tax=Helcobacillus TaxID=1161125 RepID=UPI001EF4E7D9|nr:MULTISPECIES: hypothetical protein [Helcobacillus]MCG7426239.1 hypothetical protein [Helcobacillus sp. ACRRO]MCT1558580.1 hypothetical protein [Helcobacillus massiliensis]MCT2037230.1 hypothetical protein [Helcobacillus massiliensis]MCT2332404.1 hypothetical protein [Helcobacillus massiliensis]MDK7742605.1 hypothetical protein [Helcobacillus massiliensis]
MGFFGGKSGDVIRLEAEVKRLHQRVDHLTALMTEILGEELPAESPPTDPYAPTQSERELAAAGRKIEAIKEYRLRTGAGLREAKTAIDQI